MQGDLPALHWPPSSPPPEPHTLLPRFAGRHLASNIRRSSQQGWQHHPPQFSAYWTDPGHSTGHICTFTPPLTSYRISTNQGHVLCLKMWAFRFEMIKTGLALRVEWRETMGPREEAMEQRRTAGTRPYQSTRKLKMGMQLRSSELVTGEADTLQGNMGKDIGGANGGLLYRRHCKGVKI